MLIIYIFIAVIFLVIAHNARISYINVLFLNYIKLIDLNSVIVENVPHDENKNFPNRNPYNDNTLKHRINLLLETKISNRSV